MFGKLLKPEVTFRLKMHKKAFGDRALPRPAAGAYSAPPDS